MQPPPSRKDTVSFQCRQESCPCHTDKWCIAEKGTFDELFKRQKSGEFSSEIEFFYTPPKWNNFTM